MPIVGSKLVVREAGWSSNSNREDNCGLGDAPHNWLHLSEERRSCHVDLGLLAFVAFVLLRRRHVSRLFWPGLASETSRARPENRAAFQHS